MKRLINRMKPKGRAPEGGEAQAAATPKRKSVVPFYRRPVARALGVVSLSGMIAGAAVWAVNSGWAEGVIAQAKWSTIKVTAEQGFTVEDVLVTGRGETARADLLDALGVARGAPILAYDFEAARKRVERLPWVLTARIERLLPDTLVVHLVERRPIALWQYQERFSLIDEEGVVITRAELGRFANLIQVVGKDAPDHVGGLLELLETQPGLKSKVKAAVRVGGRRWDLLLAGGVSVRLPENGAPEALARLADFNQETGVLGREVRTLDLRLPDRVIVRRPMDEKTPGKKRKPGQET